MPGLQAFYCPLQAGPLGQRFCLWHTPSAHAPRALVVQVHAFAEEMNKSRRMVALQARALAADGAAVLQMDLLGCGDSAGEFSDASWLAWLDDVVAAVALARQRHAETWPGSTAPPLWLWGQRSGALLAAEAAGRLSVPTNLLLWQPVAIGKTALQQFLRLASVGALLGKGSEKDGARAALLRGEVAQVAGYGLAPALAQGLEAARLHPPTQAARLVWLDVAANADQSPSPLVQSTLAAWQAAGWQTQHQTVNGPSFWQTTEIEEAPDLITATVRAMASIPRIGSKGDAVPHQVAA